MFNDTKLVRYGGRDLKPRDDLELEILRDAESYRRNAAFDKWLRRDLIRFYGSAFLFAFLVFTLKIVLDV